MIILALAVLSGILGWGTFNGATLLCVLLVVVFLARTVRSAS